MTGRILQVRHDPDPRPHDRCKLPGRGERRRLGMSDTDFGTIWECSCGRRYEWVGLGYNFGSSGWRDATYG